MTIKKIPFLLLIAALLCAPAFAAEQESEHPPLPENTRRAIAAYKRAPSDANKAALLRVMNENYDAIIQLKKDNLAERVRDRDKNIDRWMKSIRSGDMPSFMKLGTENHKGDERSMIASAVDVYRKNPSPQTESAVKTALDAYYDAFLDEQVKHIKDTEDSREQRMAASLERFTSDRFRPGVANTKTAIKQEDALAEIVPVNPEARVRERGFNSAINTAQAAWLKNPTEANLAALQTQIAKALQTAYDVRVEECAKAEKKGMDGSRALLA